VSVRYIIRPKADQDLENQAYYLATKATPEIGHRFLVAAHETFALLGAQPGIGWHPRLRGSNLASVRVFPISGFKKMLVFYRPLSRRIEVLRVIHGSRNISALLRREGLE
jgi:toxin ParE1/3/4